MQQAEGAMLARPREGRYVPLRDHVKKFEVLRLRALARATELVEQANGHPAATNRQPSAPAKYGFELPVATSDGLIAGQIDRVTPGHGGAIVQDYKSGAIFSDLNGQSEIKHEYQVQLKMYGALYAEQTGDWPSKLEIIPLSGDAQEIPFTRDECAHLLETARSILAGINDAIHANQGNHEQVEMLLAETSATACKYCPFRPSCSVYLSELPQDESDWPADVFGHLAAIRGLNNGAYILEIRAKGDQPMYLRDVTDSSLREAGLDNSDQGKNIGVFNALRTKSPTAFEARAFTTILKEDCD